MNERYLEDFAVGQIFASGRLLVSQERIKISFAEFYLRPFHLDETRARDGSGRQSRHAAPYDVGAGAISKVPAGDTPMTKVAHADDDTQAYIAETIEAHPIVLFMKGAPSHPQCGFSAMTINVLQHYDLPVHTIDVLRDPALRQGIKIYSDWPTIPQLYVDGVFIGGCDIVREMHESGELESLLTDRHKGLQR